MRAFFDLCEEASAATRDEWKVYETDGSAGRTYPDRRLRSGASSGLCGDGYGGRGAKITTLDGFFGAPRGGGARNRLLGCWQRLNAAYDTPSLDELSRSRVQLFRRGFGLTLLIGLWYEPVQKAFEVIRRHRYDLARMRKMAVVVDAVMYAHQEIRESVSNVGLPSTTPLPEGPTAPGSAATVKVLVNYSDRHPLTDGPHIPPRTPPAALSAADRALRDAAADRINPADSPINGLRSLRNQVHRYLALSLDSAATDRFPTFMARAEEVRGLSDVGLGLFASQASALADDAPFPRAGADIEGPHRLIGLEAFFLMQYIDWWNRIPRRGATSAAREDALSERIRLLTRSNLHPTPDPGFGWCFTGLREIAGCVAMHGFAEMAPQEMAARASLLANIVRG